MDHSRWRNWLDRKRHYAAVFVRALVGVHLIVATHDHLLSLQAFSRFSEMLAAHGIPWPTLFAVVSLAAQAFAGIAFLLGAATRPAAALMIVNFLVALVAVHAEETYADAFPALAMLAGSLFLLVHGAGAPSVDAMLARRLYQGSRDDAKGADDATRGPA